LGVIDDPSIIPKDARQLDEEERLALIGEMQKIVGSSHLFKSLDDEGRRRILVSGYVCTFAEGDAILRQGDGGDIMYLVLNGRVRVTTETPGGNVHLAELGRDACIGEVSVLTGSPRTANVTALTKVDCVAFKRHRIQRILDGYPKVRKLLEDLIEHRANDAIEKIVGS
jgi:CRP-like cAMP-binding protein